LSLIDEDNMTTNSATRPPSQQSVKAYADTKAAPPASAGTVGTSETVQVDSNKDITGFRNVTLTGELDAATGDFSGDVDIDGTLEADAITVNGTALNTVIAGVTSTNATNAATFTATANNSTDETVYPVFVDGATGSQGAETDTGFTYNPSTGLVTAVGLTLSGNLTVNGTTTTINSTTLAVDDKNIELGSVDTPSDTTADGGGITLKGATDKTITWTNSTDTWDFNQGITTTGEVNVSAGGSIRCNMRHSSGGNFVIKNPTVASLGFGINNADDSLVINNSGNVVCTGSVSDSKGNVRSIPQNTQTSAYVPVTADSGKVVAISSGGITINTGVMLVGDVITIINNSGSDQTITQGSGFTMYHSGDGSTGNRTLGARGMATLWYGAQDWGYISGAGLS
jgi:hypothetical protein